MKFIVNNSIWNLIFVKPSSKMLERSDGTRTIGVTDNNLKSVCIANNLSDYMKYRVLCHELVHVYCFENNIDFDIETEEKIASFVANYGKDIVYKTDEIIEKALKNIV